MPAPRNVGKVRYDDVEVGLVMAKNAHLRRLLLLARKFLSHLDTKKLTTQELSALSTLHREIDQYHKGG